MTMVLPTFSEKKVGRAAG